MRFGVLYIVSKRIIKEVTKQLSCILFVKIYFLDFLSQTTLGIPKGNPYKTVSRSHENDIPMVESRHVMTQTADIRMIFII